MAAKRISKTMINWAAFAERVPPDQRVMFQAFKTRSDGYFRRVNAYPEQPPTIDWSFYRSRIAVSGLVDEFEKSFKALSVPYPSEKVTPEIDAQQKEAVSSTVMHFQQHTFNEALYDSIGKVLVLMKLLEKKTIEFIKQSNENIAECQKQLDWIKALLPFDQMTMEDYRDAFPQYALDPINRPTFWPHEIEEEEETPTVSSTAEKPQVATATA